jgi:hypothetical protein
VGVTFLSVAKRRKNCFESHTFPQTSLKADRLESARNKKIYFTDYCFRCFFCDMSVKEIMMLKRNYVGMVRMEPGDLNCLPKTGNTLTIENFREANDVNFR